MIELNNLKARTRRLILRELDMLENAEHAHANGRERVVADHLSRAIEGLQKLCDELAD